MTETYHSLSPSNISDYRRCRRYWNWARREELEPNKPVRALDDGTAVHKAFEVYYDPEHWQDTNRSVRADFAILHFQATMRDSLKLVRSRGYEPSEEELADFNKSYEVSTGALEHYFARAAKLDRFTPIAVEHHFKVALLDVEPDSDRWIQAYCKCCSPPRELWISGKIDMVAEDEDGDLIIVDWKHVGKFANIEPYLSLDEQQSMYMLGYQLETGRKVTKGLYVEVKKDYPQPPKILKDGTVSADRSQSTSYELYVDALYANPHPKRAETQQKQQDFLDWLKEHGEERYLRRFEVTRSQRELSLLMERLIDQHYEMLEPPHLNPEPTSFKCPYCVFLGACTAKNEGSDYKTILALDFHKRVHDEAVAEEVPF